MDVQKVGFVALADKGTVAFPIPRLLRSSREIPPSRRAVQACPAVNGFERKVIEVLAPFSLQIRCKAKVGGAGFDFHQIDEGTRIDSELIGEVVSFMPKEVWRSPHYPVVQIALPHVFISDDPLFLSQVPAWASSDAIRLPGRMISGRFQADVWPRPLNLAFEWVEMDRDFLMKRGQPICYLFAETSRLDSRIQLTEAVMTKELRKYLDQISDVVKYTSGSFDLFERARQIRPLTLLKEIERD